MLEWCATADASAFDAVFAAYARGPIAILLAGAAIDQKHHPQTSSLRR
jgi:hypothetical protein